MNVMQNDRKTNINCVYKGGGEIGREANLMRMKWLLIFQTISRYVSLQCCTTAPYAAVMGSFPRCGSSGRYMHMVSRNKSRCVRNKCKMLEGPEKKSSCGLTFNPSAPLFLVSVNDVVDVNLA